MKNLMSWFQVRSLSLMNFTTSACNNIIGSMGSSISGSCISKSTSKNSPHLIKRWFCKLWMSSHMHKLIPLFLKRKLINGLMDYTQFLLHRIKGRTQKVLNWICKIELEKGAYKLKMPELSHEIQTDIGILLF